MRKANLTEFSQEEVLEIRRNLNQWMWDERLGRKPFLFDYMNNYKKPHNTKYRLELLIRAIWPFTKEDYIRRYLPAYQDKKG